MEYSFYVESSNSIRCTKMSFSILSSSGGNGVFRRIGFVVDWLLCLWCGTPTFAVLCFSASRIAHCSLEASPVGSWISKMLVGEELVRSRDRRIVSFFRLYCDFLVLLTYVAWDCDGKGIRSASEWDRGLVSFFLLLPNLRDCFSEHKLTCKFISLIEVLFVRKEHKQHKQCQM